MLMVGGSGQWGVWGRPPPILLLQGEGWVWGSSHASPPSPGVWRRGSALLLQVLGAHTDTALLLSTAHEADGE